MLPSVTAIQNYALTCSGPGGTAEATAVAMAPKTFPRTCENWAGNWVGNVFALNNFDLNAVAPRQCMDVSVADDGTITMNLVWSFDNSSSGVKADPVIFYGKVNPGISAAQSSTAGFPVRTADLSPTLGVQYTNVVSDVSPGGAYDLLIDLYFGKSTDINVQTLELSILPICVNVCYGTVADVVTIDNVRYNVFPPVPTGNPNYWGQLAFAVADGNVATGTITLKPFIDYAIAHGYLSENDHFVNFTVQNEVYAGAAKSVITAKITP